MHSKRKRILGMTQGQIIILGILSILLVWSIVTLIDLTSSTEKPSPSNTLPRNTPSLSNPTSIPTLRPNNAVQLRDPDAYHISGDGWFGCNDREYFDKLVEYMVEDDQVFKQVLIDGIFYGECTLFDNGEQVYLNKTVLFSGLVKIRRQGETQELWTFMEAIESNH